MHDYTFNSININGKIVKINEILLNNITPGSEFEKYTYDFIRDWLNGVEHFTINTRGSTGTPKHSALMTIQALGLQKNNTALVCLNTNYIGGKMMLARALLGNMKINAVEPATNPLKNVIQSFDFIALVPLQLQAILESSDRHKLDHVQSIIIGGAPINSELQSEIKKIQSPVYATYGMTETVSHIALQHLNSSESNSYFKTLPQIKIQSDERGCLIIEAPYLNQKIYTNDLVKIINEENFLWLGRWDNIINTGGVKVIPEKIEAEIEKINAYKNINQKFFICGIPDERLGEKVVLIIEGEIHSAWQNILLSLKQTCSKYEYPKEIRSALKFTYTNNSKINRKITMQTLMA
jgi:o-succinylbenzoate---CoA ligase